MLRTGWWVLMCGALALRLYVMAMPAEANARPLDDFPAVWIVWTPAGVVDSVWTDPDKACRRWWELWAKDPRSMAPPRWISLDTPMKTTQWECSVRVKVQSESGLRDP